MDGIVSWPGECPCAGGGFVDLSGRKNAPVQQYHSGGVVAAPAPAPREFDHPVGGPIPPLETTHWTLEQLDEFQPHWTLEQLDEFQLAWEKKRSKVSGFKRGRRPSSDERVSDAAMSAAKKEAAVLLGMDPSTTADRVVDVQATGYGRRS
jgi:hypothetical protein